MADTIDTSNGIAPRPAPIRRARPARPSNLAHGRWLGDFPRLSATERKLLACCKNGTLCKIGTGQLPDVATRENTVRAELVRFLILGGDASNPTHERGVDIEGAWIRGRIELNNSKASGYIRLINCQLDGVFVASDANIQVLDLEGSNTKGISAERAKIDGSLLIRNGFVANGEIRLTGASIGGNLSCIRGKFNNLTSDGKINGRALMLQETKVANGMLFREFQVKGYVDLTAASAGSLVIDWIGWPDEGLILDGFQYDRMPAGGIDAASGIKWLNKQYLPHRSIDFRPQPWEQLIKVLRGMGHPYEASKVAMEKQRQWRHSWLLPWWRPRRFLSKIYGTLAGYGYRPWWTVGWMAATMLICSLFFYEGQHDGLFGPTAAPIQLSNKLEMCGDGGTPGKIYWTSPSCPIPPEYTSFQPVIYSLDVILPFVNLGQEDAWAPIVSNERGENLLAGQLLRGLIWFEIIFGWLTGVLLAAVAGNLVKKD